MPPRPSFSAQEVARLRLQALGLAGSWFQGASPLSVVEHHLAMQAQDFPASRWAIGSRLDGGNDDDVRQAYARGELVRSWPMRGTVHVTAARDFPWMLALMGDRALAGVGRRWAQLGIDESFVERAREVALLLLRGGRSATRTELAEACTQAGLEMSGQRVYHTTWYLAQTGTLVQGPMRDEEHELVLLDEWIPEPRRLDRHDALKELATRYLRGHGPASIEDLVHWTKLTKRDCRGAMEAAGDAVVAVDGPGGEYWMLGEQLDTLDPGSAAVDHSVLALAAFDEHLLGYRVRDAVLDQAHASLVTPGANGVFRWTIVVAGRVVATWQRTRRTHYTIADVSPFMPLNPKLHGPIEAAIGRWGAFANTPVEVRWTASEK